MRLTVEEADKTLKTLFLYKTKSPLIELIEKHLKEHHVEVFSSTKLPIRSDQFDYIFIFTDHAGSLHKLSSNLHARPIFFFFSNVYKWQKIISELPPLAKAINLDEKDISADTIENCIWFIFTDSNEKGLNLEKLIKPKKVIPARITFKKKIKKRYIYLSLFILFLIFEFFFIIPLSFSSLFLYKSAKALENYQLDSSEKYLNISTPFLNMTKASYSLSRPVLSFLFVAISTDTIINLEDTTSQLLDKTISTGENAQNIISLIVTRNKTSDQIDEVKYRIATLKNQIDFISSKIEYLVLNLDYPLPQIQNTKDFLTKTETSLVQAKNLLDQSDDLIGGGKEKNYLLLFENNMELRPGGGFIGSFGIATFKDYTLDNLAVHDVYEADGQLKEQVDPPFAVRTYLNEPHWFLRDSNFSPDFPTNFNQAVSFLEKEIQVPSFDGGAVITTTAIDNILSSIGDIYLPDYNDTITKDNFYIKTELQVENNFFSGSTQKQTFLSSLVKQLMIKIEASSPKSLYSGLKKSLDEKQMALYFTDPKLEKYVDQAGWSGKLLSPTCAVTTSDCILDTFSPIDANVGVNKANFFLEKSLGLKVRIMDDGTIQNTGTILYQNNSSYDVFPGGIYKNYEQIFLPAQSKVKQITKNGTLIDTFDSSDNGPFNIVSFYMEVAPKATDLISIEYELPQKVQTGKGAYQLIVQKQIGSPNTDLGVTFDIPDNLSITNKNFNALAKDQNLIYNTSLSTDKIFLLEFTKK